jgi:hypothetical protein
MSFFDKSKLKQYYQILKNVICNIINADNIFYKFNYFGKRKMYSYSRTPMPGQIVLNVLLFTVLPMDGSETGHGAKPAVDVNVWVPASSYRACPRMPIDPTQDAATTPRFSADCSRAQGPIEQSAEPLGGLGRLQPSFPQLQYSEAKNRRPAFPARRLQFLPAGVVSGAGGGGD